MSKATAAEASASHILQRLHELRSFDAPTHGGRVLAYVYDPGQHALDALASEAAEMARPLNALDPTTFPSVAAMERDLIAFVRRALNGDKRRLGGKVVGSVTSGGTESCLLAVKTARDLWRESSAARVRQARGATKRPRLVAPTHVHAAFHKAARLFDLDLDLVPCEPDGSVRASAIIERLDDDVALVVVSAPNYPAGSIDPVAQVSQAALGLGVRCHVDACFGGLALPWWPDAPVWDLRLAGVTSISADLHKFGYAPKGVSVLLHRGRVQHRTQFFAITGWPGYPVVNPTLLGSRSASPLAAAWAITQQLGETGYRTLTSSIVRSTRAIAAEVADIRGLAVQGDPIGPALSLVADLNVSAHERVDPHLLADEVGARGFVIQPQPGVTQPNGVRLPHSAHLTITPVTERTLADLCAVLRHAADAVRGKPKASATAALTAMRLLGYSEHRVPGPAASWAILKAAGAVPKGLRSGTTKPYSAGRLAGLMTLVEELPAAVGEALLIELLARMSEPR